MSEGGLSASGNLGTSKGGICEKLPVGLTVVFSNIIFIFEFPTKNHITFSASAYPADKEIVL